MADCHACELHTQGEWQVRRERDADALELWKPVLEGEFTCAHEPHTVLASSLAPLLRLGRTEEARAHHLRGFRLVRPMESMRGAYADHVEFCALSGNEARGLELLAERPAYFTDSGNPRSGLDFLSVVTLLMDRLTALGLGDQEVPGPTGRTWTARELAVHARAEALSWPPASTSATARRTSATGHARAHGPASAGGTAPWGAFGGQAGRRAGADAGARGHPGEGPHRAPRGGAAAVGHPPTARRRGLVGRVAGRRGRRAVRPRPCRDRRPPGDGPGTGGHRPLRARGRAVRRGGRPR